MWSVCTLSTPMVQDDLEPIGVFCNISSTAVTAVLHHNLEEWSHNTGYEGIGSYEGQLCTVGSIGHDNQDMILNLRCEQYAYCFAFRLVKKVNNPMIYVKWHKTNGKIVAYFRGVDRAQTDHITGSWTTVSNILIHGSMQVPLFIWNLSTWVKMVWTIVVYVVNFKLYETALYPVRIRKSNSVSP